MKIPRGSFIYLTLFLVLSAPFVLALIPQEFRETDFSIYNEGWNGTSEFRSLVEKSDNVEVKTLMGSTNALNRVSNSTGADAGALVIMGPKVTYDPTEAIAILLYAAKGGRVLIADDYGTANDILYYFSILLEALANTALSGANGANVFGMSQEQADDPLGLEGLSCENAENRTNPFPIVGLAINHSVLVDTGSFYRSPIQPVLSPPPAAGLNGTSYNALAPWLEPMVEDVDSVIGNYAATISMKVTYPTNFTNINDEEDIISITEWTAEKKDDGTTISKCDYEASVWEVTWVPMGEFPVEVTSVKGIDLPDTYSFSMRLSALYSSQKSWLEANTTAAKDVEKIRADPSEWGNVEFPAAIHFPLGEGVDAGSLTIVSDPSIFINRYVREERYDDCTGGILEGSCEADPEFDPTNYDNRQFALNIIKMLIGDRAGNGTTIYFDEGHLARALISPALYMGTFFRFLDMLTMFPLLAPILPITVIGMAKRYAPKGAVARGLLMTKVETYYGRSYFAYKMRWFLEYRHYKRGIELIYRRLKRDLTKRYRLTMWSPEIAYQALIQEFPTSLRKDTLKKMKKLESLLSSDAEVETEEQFMEHYLSIKDIADLIKG